jgi:uncharacterized protein YjbJ (UPF0337 family)
MKVLSDQLQELSDRSKKTEDLLVALREKNSEQLAAARADLKASISEGNTRAKALTAQAKGKVEGRWGDMRDSVEQRFTSIQEKADARRAAKGIDKAEHRAEVAEKHAADAIELAMYLLDQADYSVVEATLARAEVEAAAPKG